jgi:hypothetical protein
MHRQILTNILPWLSAALLALSVVQTAAAQVVEATVGSGPDLATVAIEFEDGAEFLFEVLFDESAPLSGLDAMLTLESELPSFSLVLIDFGFGLLIDGIAYNGHSNEGFGGGELYWHYWTRPGELDPWTFSAIGSVDRLLSDGTWDGWVYGSALPPREPSLLVPIDIKPGSGINPVNPFSNGLIPVAILGTDSFDAANIDANTLAFGPNEAAPSHWHHTHLDDIDGDGDGFEDLIAHFRTAETGLAVGALGACVSGQTLDGTPFEGCDGVRIVVACGLGFELTLLLPPLFAIRQRLRRRRGAARPGSWDHSAPVFGS